MFPHKLVSLPHKIIFARSKYFFKLICATDKAWRALYSPNILPNNNRPISLFPVLSKVCERVAHNQLTTYLVSKDRLMSKESGNKQHHPTETTLIHTADLTLHARDDKQKAFIRIIEIRALPLAENGVIFRYNHLRGGEYSGRTNFLNLMKESAIPRNSKHPKKIGMTLFKGKM